MHHLHFSSGNILAALKAKVASLLRDIYEPPSHSLLALGAGMQEPQKEFWLKKRLVLEPTSGASVISNLLQALLARTQGWTGEIFQAGHF